MIINDKLENALEYLSPNSIDMVFTDLPYGTTNCKWDTPVDLEKMWEILSVVTKERTPMLFTAQAPFNAILGASNIKQYKYEWIWEKTQATGHLNAKKMPMKAHENVLMFYKKPPLYQPIKTHGHKRKISTAVHKRNTKPTDIYHAHENFSDYNSTERYPRSVIKIKSDKQKNSLHPTQKPEALLEYFINTYSKEGDTILDLSAGSGTTGIVAERLGRKCILFDKEKHWCDVMEKRFKTQK